MQLGQSNQTGFSIVVLPPHHPTPPLDVFDLFGQPNLTESNGCLYCFLFVPQQEDVRRAHGDAEGEDGQKGRTTGADAPGEGGQA